MEASHIQTYILTADSAPLKGAYLLLGDWPYRVINCKPLSATHYKVTLMRKT